MIYRCAKCGGPLPKERNVVLKMLSKCGVDAKPVCDACWAPMPKKKFFSKAKNVPG